MKENQHTEWKETWRDEFLRWICGFANAEGGVLVIGRNDAVVRRFFTAQSNPELRTIAAMAEALDADIRIVPRRTTARRRATADVAGG